MAKKSHKHSGPVMSWRPTDEDRKLINELKAKMGIVSESDLVRISLRRLAEAEGLNR